MEIIKRYKPLMDAFSDLYFIVKNINGEYVYANTAFLNVVGNDMSFLYARPEDVFNRSSDQMRMLDGIDKMLISGELGSSRNLINVTNQRGEKKSLLIHKIPLKGKSGVVGVLGIGIGMTKVSDALKMMIDRSFSGLTDLQKRVYWFNSRRDSEPAEAARLMDITVENYYKIKSETFNKIGFKDYSEEAKLFEWVYKTLLYNTYDTYDE